jgi:hypothetical protein
MKTTIELAREAGLFTHKELQFELELFANLVRADEREACAELVYHSPPSDEYESPLKAVYHAIRNRGQV